MTTLLLLIIAGLVWYIWKQSSAPKPSPNLVVTITTTTSREADSQADKDAWGVPDLDLYGPGQRMRQLWLAAVAIVQSDNKTHEQEAQFLRYAAEKWGIPKADVPALDTSAN